MAKAQPQPEVSTPTGAAPEGKLLLMSSTGLDRYRGHYIVPPIGHAPLVLDLASIAPGDLGEIEGDDKIIKLRTDMPFTPEHEIRRY